MTGMELAEPQVVIPKPAGMTQWSQQHDCELSVAAPAPVQDGPDSQTQSSTLAKALSMTARGNQSCAGAYEATLDSQTMA